MRWQEGEPNGELDHREFTRDSAESKGAERSAVTYPLSSLVRSFVGLRWRLLRGAIRHGGAEQVGAVASLVASTLIGVTGAVVAYVAGRTSSHADDLSVIFCTVFVVAGMTTELGALPLTLLAGASWLMSLLLVARTATNLLALLHSRFPRLGQMTAGLFGLLFYGAFQFVPILLQRLDSDDRTN